MAATPDTLVADGFSKSTVQATVRNESGNPRSGVTVNFEITSPDTDMNRFFDLGNLAAVGWPRPVAGGSESRPVSAVTDGGGNARVTYWAPFRTDQENDITVSIGSRATGTNFRGDVHRTVDIFLRAANRPSFPGGECFMVEPQKAQYVAGELIFFTASVITGAAGHPIARYEWDFGDGVAASGRNTQHSFVASATNFTVTLYTTESVTGAQASCTKNITVTATGAPAPPPPPTTCSAASATITASQICPASGEILQPQAVLFNGSASTAGTGATMTSYAWDFGDAETASGVQVTHTYAVGLVGLEVKVMLTVTNSCGATATTTQTFSVVSSCGG